MNYLFLVFTFIIMVVLVTIAPDTLTAMFMVSLVANFFTISSNMIRLNKLEIFKWPDLKLPQAPSSIIADPDPMTSPMTSPHSRPDSDMYGKHFDQYCAYKEGYSMYDDPAVIVGDADSSMDVANVMMTQRRTRDKRAIDGMVTKDTNYYRYHFGNELREAERKPWWGRNEY